MTPIDFHPIISFIRIAFPWERPAQVTSSGERLFAIPNALGNFRYGARALRDLVLNLDVGRKRPLLLLHQLQDLLQRRPSHAPRYVPPIGGPALQMQADDPVVISLEHRKRRLSLGAGEVVPDVEVEADVLPQVQDRV